jgi:hypothetical protein
VYVARRTYRRRLGFAQQDFAISAEGDVIVLRSGWRFIGRRPAPLCEIVGEGWIPRPAQLRPRSTELP